MRFVKFSAPATVALMAFSLHAAAAGTIDDCEMTGQKGTIKIDKPARPGQFTLELNLPAAAWGKDPASIPYFKP